MATSNFGEVGDDSDVLGKAINDYDAKDTCEISMKKGNVIVLCVR